MKAWLFQDHRQKDKLGDKAPWCVGWLDPGGSRRSKRVGSKSNAEKFARRVEGELAAGTYESRSRVQLADFRQEYEAKRVVRSTSKAREHAALNNFLRLVGVKRLASIDAKAIDDYVARRGEEKSKRTREKVSPATINAELRVVKSMLRTAYDWGYIGRVPKVRMVKEPKKLATFVSPEHFASIYGACDKAHRPNDIANVDAGDWWRALLVFAYMTGWRISEILALSWADVDLEEATAITRADDNKGGRDELIPLHPVIVDHLRTIAGGRFSQKLVFPWLNHRRTLYTEFQELQAEAGVLLLCRRQHKHRPACHVYGFHDFRRAFATVNVARLTPDALQKLMRHKSYITTQRYIAMAGHLGDAVAQLHVPEVVAKPAKAN